jgi:hypothetical protein
VFLDNVTELKDVVTYWEHKIAIQDRPFYYFTCTVSPNCYLCQKGNPASNVYVLTVAEYIPDGRWVKKLFSMKIYQRDSEKILLVWNKISKYFQVMAQKTLRFARFTAARMIQTEPRVGGDFMYSGHLTEQEAAALGDTTPFDYKTVLAPKPDSYFIELEKKVTVRYDMESIRRLSAKTPVNPIFNPAPNPVYRPTNWQYSPPQYTAVFPNQFTYAPEQSIPVQNVSPQNVPPVQPAPPYYAPANSPTAPVKIKR